MDDFHMGETTPPPEDESIFPRAFNIGSFQTSAEDYCSVSDFQRRAAQRYSVHDTDFFAFSDSSRNACKKEETVPEAEAEEPDCVTDNEVPNLQEVPEKDNDSSDMRSGDRWRLSQPPEEEPPEMKANKRRAAERQKSVDPGSEYRQNLRSMVKGLKSFKATTPAMKKKLNTRRKSSGSSKAAGGSSVKKQDKEEKVAVPVTGNENCMPSEEDCQQSNHGQYDDSCQDMGIPEVPDSDKLPRKKRQMLQEVNCNQSPHDTEGQNSLIIYVNVLSCIMFVLSHFVANLMA